MRRLLLAAFLFCPVAARAQSDNAEGAVSGFKEQGKQLAEDVQARRDELAAVQESGLTIDVLSNLGWNAEQIMALGETIRLGGKAVFVLHARYPSAVADAYGSGVMTNIEDTFKLFGGGNLERGCLSHQAATLKALSARKSKALDARKIMIGMGMEHHAVVVFPKGSDWEKEGILLDGWLNQSDKPKEMVFTMKQWKNKLLPLRFSGERLED